MKTAKPMTILVSNVPADVFDRVAEQARQHGVSPQKSDVVRWGLAQFLRLLDEQHQRSAAGSAAV